MESRNIFVLETLGFSENQKVKSLFAYTLYQKYFGPVIEILKVWKANDTYIIDI